MPLIFYEGLFLQGMAKSINKERNQNEGQRMFFIYSFHFVVAEKDPCICSLFSLEQIKVCLKSRQKITRAVLQKKAISGIPNPWVCLVKGIPPCHAIIYNWNCKHLWLKSHRDDNLYLESALRIKIFTHCPQFSKNVILYV